MILDKIGAGGYFVMTDETALIMVAAGINDSSARPWLLRQLRDYSFRDKTGEIVKTVKIYTNTIVPYQAGVHDLQSNLAIMLGEPGTEDVTEALWVEGDGVGVEVSAGKLQIKDNGVRQNKIHTSAVDAGLQITGGKVKFFPDGTTVGFNGDQVRIVPAGVGTTQLGSQSVTNAKLHANVAGGGIAGGAGVALQVNYDNTTIGLTGGGLLEVRTGGIITAKVADGAITPVKNSASQRYFTMLIDVDAANTGSDNLISLKADFNILGVTYHVVKTIAGGDLTALFTLNGVASNTLTVASGTLQDATGSHALTVVPYPVTGAVPNTIKAAAGGAATGGIVRLSISCEWV